MQLTFQIVYQGQGKDEENWTWHDLWKFLTIPLKDKHIIQTDQGFICKCISHQDWRKSSDLQCSKYWKIHLWNHPPPSLPLDLIIDLLPSRTTRPINVAKKLCPPSAMKSFFRRKYHYTEGATMPMLGKKFVRGYVFLYYLRGSGLKLINILELAKMRIVWQNRAVSWAIM